MAAHPANISTATPRECWVLEAFMLGLAAAAAIGAGIWFHSPWIGIAAGVVAFPCVGCVRSALARRFGWRRHSLGRAAALAFQVLAAIWTILDFVAIFV